jgi:hypothetical protein
MAADWQRRRILIWGKTRPEMSAKYREIVCTGGVFEDTRRLVRLYPVPLRYMDNDRVFRKYQWIEAAVRPALRDPRPESYNIHAEDITLGECVGTERATWATRASWVLAPQNLFTSVEELQQRQAAEQTSLGIVQPKAVTRVLSRRVPKAEREVSWERYRETTR